MKKFSGDWRDWLADLLGLQPDDRMALVTMLKKLKRRGGFVSVEEMKMIEGVLGMRDLKIRDVMLPLSDVARMKLTDDYAAAVAVVRDWQHSRYPVTDEGGANVMGILLAKDLLGYTDRPDAFQMKAVMREAMFEPDSKPLDALLQDFRANRSHMVIVRDEYTQTVGIVTIEDLLERIVGEIEDESDDESDRSAQAQPDGSHIVKGAMPLEELRDLLGGDAPDGAATVADWLAQTLGRMPQKGDSAQTDDWHLSVISADRRRVHSVRARRREASDS